MVVLPSTSAAVNALTLSKRRLLSSRVWSFSYSSPILSVKYFAHLPEQISTSFQTPTPSATPINLWLGVTTQLSSPSLNRFSYLGLLWTAAWKYGVASGAASAWANRCLRCYCCKQPKLAAMVVAMTTENRLLIKCWLFLKNIFVWLLIKIIY